MSDLWVKVAKEHIELVFPLQLHTELTNRCQLSCSFCPYHAKTVVTKPEPCDMEYLLYLKLINEGAKNNLQSVKFGFGGEPLLHRDIIKAVRDAKSRGIQVRINTNGIALNIEMVEDLLNANVDVLTLSDYGHKIQYQHGILFSAQKQALDKNTQFIVKTNDPKKWEGIADKIEPFNILEYNNFKKNNDPSDFSCEIPFQRILILADGTVYKCACGYMHVLKRLGNAYISTIRELWNSAVMKFLRYCHSNQKSHLVDICQICAVRRKYINGKE